MFGQEVVESLIKRTLHLSDAPETEVAVLAQHDYLTRFANSGIHQNVNEKQAVVHVRAVDGKRVGRANTADLSDGGLEKAAERALLHARSGPEDPHFPGLPDPQPVPTVAAVDPDVQNMSPDARAEDVGTLCAQAKDNGLDAFGAFSTGLREVGVGSSKGISLYHAHTLANLQTVMMGENGSGWAQAAGWQAADINADAVAREAVDKARRAQKPRKLEPGPYTVVLDPYAVGDIVSWLNIAGVGAHTVQEGRSWMNDRIGQQVMDERISIYDDGADPTGVPQPFGYQGVPRQRVEVVAGGTVKSPVYDHYLASREGKRSTGHALPPDAPSYVTGPLGLNMFMAGGAQTVEEMIASTERGLYITRFWYTRLVHPRDCILTGMTRDGVYLIENGELAGPVKDLRFTQSYVEALSNVEAVGEATHLMRNNMINLRVPALKIRDFNFTGVTV